MLDRRDAVVVAADGLRPQAEGAARFAAAARVPGHVGVLQIAAEIFLDLELACRPAVTNGSLSMFVQDFALGIVRRSTPFGVAIGEALDRRPVAPSASLLDGEVIFVAGDEIDAPAQACMLSSGSTATLAPMKPILARRIDRADHARPSCTSDLKTGVEVWMTISSCAFTSLFDVLEGEIVRRRVDQLASPAPSPRPAPARSETRTSLHLALHLVARAGAAVIAVEGRSLQKERAHRAPFKPV